MPESPDFDQIAYALLVRGSRAVMPHDVPPAADELRRLWNARGAADLAAVEATLDGMEGVKAAAEAVRRLDR